MSEIRYFPHSNLMSNVPRLENNPHGLWCCAVDSDPANMERDDDGEMRPAFTAFIEVHRSTVWEKHKKVVFRISEVNYWGDRMQLGECVLLDKEGVTQVRDLLNALLEEMEAK